MAGLDLGQKTVVSRDKFEYNNSVIVSMGGY